MDYTRYEVVITMMDDECNNSTSIIDVDTRKTFNSAKSLAQRTVQNLISGKWNRELNGVNFVYVAAHPYNNEGEYDCDAPYFDSGYYKRVNNKWIKA